MSLEGFLTRVHVPGSGPLLITVGRVVYRAEVLGTHPNGVPLTGPPVDILFEAGVNHGSILDACQALAP